MIRIILLASTLLLAVIFNTHAALNDQGGGLIYDDVLDTTWLQDANMVKTLCDANDPLWQSWDPTLVPNNSGRSKSDICTSGNGRLNWHEAEDWIDHLNSNSYLGFSDWGQPITNPVDGVAYNYNSTYDGSTDDGYNISGPDGAYPGSTGSELAHMHYNSLGNGSWFDTAGNIQQAAVCPAPDFCVQNSGPFVNIQSFAYWSSTEYAPDSTNAWGFSTFFGGQGSDSKDLSLLNVWPVRSNQSAAPPISVQSIPTLSEWGLILTALIMVGFAWRRIRLFG